jgi:hypothetical protein
MCKLPVIVIGSPQQEFITLKLKGASICNAFADDACAELTTKPRTTNVANMNVFKVSPPVSD